MRLLTPALALLLVAHTPVHALEIPPLPEAVTSFGAVIAGGKLYAYGGHLAGSHSWSLETTSGKLRAFDLQTPGAWEDLPGGPRVQSPAVATHEGKIYLLGGMQPQNAKGEDAVLKAQDHAMVFDPSTGKWADLPRMPEPRSSHEAVVWQDKLYVVGGWPLNTGADKKEQEPGDGAHRRGFHNTMLVLDLARPDAGWEALPQPFERRAIAAVANAGRIYVLGGMDEKNKVSAQVDVYDIATKTWSKAPDLPGGGRVKGFATAACSLRGEVIASPRGGKIFALREGDWVEVAKLGQSRFFHQFEPWNDASVIALGGTTGDEPLATAEVVAIPAAKTVGTVKP